MYSRHKHNSPPSEIPTEFLFEISDALNSQFKKSLSSSEKELFSSNALIYQTEVVLVITLSKPSGVRAQNFYASIDYLDQKTSVSESIYHLVDGIGFYLDEFFSSERQTQLPEDWSSFSINDKKIYMKGDNKNLNLEKLGTNILENQNSSSGL